MTQYLDTPGTSGHYVRAPGEASLDTSGSIDVRVRIKPDAIGTFFCRRQGGSSARIFRLYATDSTTIGMNHYDSSEVVDTDAEAGFTDLLDGNIHDIRVVLNFGTGFAEFYERVSPSVSLDSDVGWTNIGNVAMTATDLHEDATIPIDVAAHNNGNAGQYDGRTDRAILYHGTSASGTKVADFNADDFQVGDSDTDTAVGSAGLTWTINGANSEIKEEAAAEGDTSLLLLGVG